MTATQLAEVTSSKDLAQDSSALEQDATVPAEVKPEQPTGLNRFFTKKAP